MKAALVAEGDIPDIHVKAQIPKRMAVVFRIAIVRDPCGFGLPNTPIKIEATIPMWSPDIARMCIAPALL